MSIERPILFNAPMVRAILSGAKTQTRRVVNPQPVADTRWRSGLYVGGRGAMAHRKVSTDAPAALLGEVCPFGQPGDRLWVRETWAPRTLGRWSVLEKHMQPLYRASEDRPEWKGIWRPSIHMPRWACRLVLEITDVRVERLQVISHRDAIAEGFRRIDVDAGYDPKYSVDQTTWADIVEGQADAYNDPRHAFRDLWTSTGGDWDSDPWAWVIEFKRVGVAGG